MHILRREGGPDCEVTLLAEAALPRSTALLCSPTNPTHPPTTLAVRTASALFKLRLAPYIWNFKFYVKFKTASRKVFRRSEYKAANLKFSVVSQNRSEPQPVRKRV